jgi:Na+-translocating ferredoxin:NAD+ oxidoreductase RnfG subunit
MASKYTKIGVGLLLGPITSINAYAEIYMSEQQAVASIFPGAAGAAMEKSKIELSSDESDKIAKNSSETVRSKSLTVWKDKEKNVVFIDQVLGKHEFITFAVGIDREGAVKGIHILEYRETYGSQVRKDDWRGQFNGKTIAAPLKLDKDIQNISGATLSSSHVTGGVRRLLNTYDIVKTRL